MCEWEREAIRVYSSIVGIAMMCQHAIAVCSLLFFFKLLVEGKGENRATGRGWSRVLDRVHSGQVTDYNLQVLACVTGGFGSSRV